MGDVDERLREAVEEEETARLAHGHALLCRDEAIAAALAAGWTHARISDATGLSRGRIGQLAQAVARAASFEAGEG